MAVIDPGVAEKAIAVQTAKGIFVGPDNGRLSWALAEEHLLRPFTGVPLRQPLSQTFHGRDVFAPVAAHLSGWGCDLRP